MADKDNKALDSSYLSRVILLLLVVAAVAVSMRLLLQKPGNYPAGDTVWMVGIESRIQVEEKGGRVLLASPGNTNHVRVYGQHLFHPGMRQQRTKKERHSRDLVLVTTRAGDLVLTTRFDLHMTMTPRPGFKIQQPADTTMAPWLASGPGIPIDSGSVTAVVDRVAQDRPEPKQLVERLFAHVSQQVRIIPGGSSVGDLSLGQGRGSVLGANRALVALLRAARIPARIVVGVDLSAVGQAQPRYWAEAYYLGLWQALDLITGELGELAPNLVPMRKGSDVVVEVEKAKLHEVVWSIEQAAPPRGLFTSEKPGILDTLDLTRLSPATRGVLGLLLLLPLGALSTEFLRHVVGIRTYGTFTPTLLALAVVYVDWVTATLVFALVTALGVSGRSLLPGLELKRIPRLTIVFTLVAFFMTLVVSMLNHFDPAVDSTVVLLPTVILTTLIDRIYTVADDSGVRVALQRLGWTIVAAVAALAVLLQDHWGEWLLTYPELHAVTIAAILLLSRYRGSCLADSRWFGWLREPAAKPARSVPAAGDQDPGQS
jgi:hypothetical protein